MARELVSTHDRAATAFDTEQRRLAIGISHQLVGSELSSLLRRMRDHDPSLLVEMRVAGTRDLMQAHEQGELDRSAEHTSELHSLMRISYAVFGLKKKKNTPTQLYQT